MMYRIDQPAVQQPTVVEAYRRKQAAIACDDAAAEAGIEQFEDVQAAQLQHPGFQLVELSTGKRRFPSHAAVLVNNTAPGACAL